MDKKEQTFDYQNQMVIKHETEALANHFDRVALTFDTDPSQPADFYGRALAFTAGITYNGNGGSLPTPEAPIFTSISRTLTNANVVLNTSPYFLVTLQTSPDLSPTNWTMIATNTPATNIWTFTDTNAMTTVPQRFYRAFITTP